MKNATALLVSALCLTAVTPLVHAQTPASAPGQPPASPATAAGKTIVERVLVRVNGEIFTQSQLTQRQIEALRGVERTAGTSLQAEIAKVTPGILVAAVDELLLVQQGRELGLTFSDEQFKSAVDNVKKSNNLDDKGLAEAMAQEGLTMEQLRQSFERSYLVQGVQQREIGPSMTITLEEQRQYYKRNSAQFMTPLTVTLRELLVTVPTRTESGKEVFSAADDQAARTKIEALRKLAIGGDDFAALVLANSESATSKSGGLVGPVNVDDLSPALKELVLGLQPGGISEPVRVARGYQIFRLDARSTPELLPFDQVRRAIETSIRNERIEPETDKMLARLRTQAVIEWKDEDLRQVYEKQIAANVQP